MSHMCAPCLFAEMLTSVPMQNISALLVMCLALQSVSFCNAASLESHGHHFLWSSNTPARSMYASSLLRAPVQSRESSYSSHAQMAPGDSLHLLPFSMLWNAKVKKRLSPVLPSVHVLAKVESTCKEARDKQ